MTQLTTTVAAESSLTARATRKNGGLYQAPPSQVFCSLPLQAARCGNSIIEAIPFFCVHFL